MTAIQSIPFLRFVLPGDALASGATGFLTDAGANLLADDFGLPELLLGYAVRGLKMPALNRPAHA
jgi:hypothetical protein